MMTRTVHRPLATLSRAWARLVVLECMGSGGRLAVLECMGSGERLAVRSQSRNLPYDSNVSLITFESVWTYDLPCGRICEIAHIWLSVSIQALRNRVTGRVLCCLHLLIFEGAPNHALQICGVIASQLVCPQFTQRQLFAPSCHRVRSLNFRYCVRGLSSISNQISRTGATYS